MTDEQKDERIKNLEDMIDRLNEINDQMLAIIIKQSGEIREYQNMERVKKIC